MGLESNPRGTKTDHAPPLHKRYEVKLEDERKWDEEEEEEEEEEENILMRYLLRIVKTLYTRLVYI